MTSDSNAHVAPDGPPSGKGPLRVGAYHLPSAEEVSQTWPEIVSVIQRGDLGDINRHEKCEEEYRGWGKPIKEHYGGLEEYIRQVRLGWEKPSGEETKVAGQEYFKAEWEHDAPGKNRVKCIPNDWPYGVPENCGHYVVWSIAPMLHELLFESEDTPFEEDQRKAIYEAVAYDGVRGLSGVKGKKVVGLRTVKALESKDEVKTQTASTNGKASNGDGDSHEEGGGEETTQSLAERAQEWAGREVSAYVKNRWPEDKWETAWFCNPPHLRTVPGLSHFHVLVRKK